MKGRTYRYFEGQPLYPFGYGLSYSKFAYSNARLSTSTLKAGSDLQVDVDVRNTSGVAGDEVVQVYLVFPKLPGAPLRALRGFQRVSIRPGETEHVTPGDRCARSEHGQRGGYPVGGSRRLHAVRRRRPAWNRRGRRRAAAEDSGRATAPQVTARGPPIHFGTRFGARRVAPGFFTETLMRSDAFTPSGSGDGDGQSVSEYRCTGEGDRDHSMHATLRKAAFLMACSLSVMSSRGPMTKYPSLSGCVGRACAPGRAPDRHPASTRGHLDGGPSCNER